MKRLVIASVITLAAAVCASDTAQASQPYGYPFFPFGFYQPYGAHYGTSLPTPPYFSVNPPVYYGARFARPYGMSPFASPPVVGRPAGYNGRLRTDFHEPPRETPAPRCNPCLSKSSVQQLESQAKVEAVSTVGPVRENPFFRKDKSETLALY